MAHRHVIEFVSTCMRIVHKAGAFAVWYELWCPRVWNSPSLCVWAELQYRSHLPNTSWPRPANSNEWYRSCIATPPLPHITFMCQPRRNMLHGFPKVEECTAGLLLAQPPFQNISDVVELQDRRFHSEIIVGCALKQCVGGAYWGKGNKNVPTCTMGVLQSTSLHVR